MNDDLMQKIRDRAHQLWEAEGRPEGRSEEHWERARQEVELADGAKKEPHGAEIVPEPERVGKGENPIRRRIRKAAGGA